MRLSSDAFSLVVTCQTSTKLLTKVTWGSSSNSLPPREVGMQWRGKWTQEGQRVEKDKIKI